MYDQSVYRWVHSGWSQDAVEADTHSKEPSPNEGERRRCCYVD